MNKDGSFHIMVTGLRGFPDIQGGIEVHAQNLYPRIVKQNKYKVTVIQRSPYITKDHPVSWHGVDFVNLYSPKSKSLETILHTFLAVGYAAVKRPDILHIHAVGPALLAPVARILGIKVVVTHHGADYERQKWGGFPKMILRLGERLGMRFSNQRIVISKTIRKSVLQKFKLDSALIYNGVQAPPVKIESGVLEKFDVVAGKYIVMVGRYVPEKCQCDLITAFNIAKPDLAGWKLVLVGNADHESAYSRRVVNMADGMDNVILTGFQTGADLQKLYEKAGMFVLPSSHEGLPLVLLEALSFGLPVIASDIDAHTEIGLDEKHYFKVRDCGDLAHRIRAFSDEDFSSEWRKGIKSWTLENYSWDQAALQVIDVYDDVLSKKKER